MVFVCMREYFFFYTGKLDLLVICFPSQILIFQYYGCCGSSRAHVLGNYSFTDYHKFVFLLSFEPDLF